LFKRLKLKHDEPLSKVAFNCNLRHFNLVQIQVKTAQDAEDPTTAEAHEEREKDIERDLSQICFVKLAPTSGGGGAG
jgi:hypothetical protein